MTEDVLVHELPATSVQRLDEAALFQEAKRAIDGRPTDLCAFPIQPGVQGVRSEVFMRLEGLLEDQITLSSELQLLRAQVLLEAMSDGGVLHGVG